jgi:glycosyltransferase involved in cell wall biosynthesis
MQSNFIVITASYNRPDLLIRNIKSLQSQEYRHWQQIIIDDASISDMQEVCSLISSDDRIHVIKLTKNKGCNYARNQALDYIKQHDIEGYITLVDDDDYLLPEALSTINEELLTATDKKWVTADCCYPDRKKASRLAYYGELSYINNYMYGKEIKGDLNHFLHSSICSDIRFSDSFKNGQEWSFFCQLAGITPLYALNYDVKVIEYLEGGLSNKKVNAKNKIKVFNYKIEILKDLVSLKKLSHQKLLLARELINMGDKRKARSLLNSIFKYQYLSLKFYRYFIKTLM